MGFCARPEFGDDAWLEVDRTGIGVRPFVRTLFTGMLLWLVPIGGVAACRRWGAGGSLMGPGMVLW
jgi:hypothetical protein